MRLEDLLRFVQIDPFPRLWAKHGLTDEDLRALEIGIMAAPERYPIIPGAGRLRKIRFMTKKSHRGKSGGYRIFYVHFPEFGTILLMAVLSKSEQADLKKADFAALSQVITRIEESLEKGVIK